MLVSFLRLLALGAAAVSGAPTVTLSGGATLSGSLETNVAGNQVQVYRGIPYADHERWKQSTLKTLTANVNATKYGATCYGAVPSAPTLGAAEDCLFLNVFSPAGATEDSKLPVMVWVHGGAFVRGSANQYESQNLIAAAGEKAVVVTFNYRIGVFGFFSNAQLLGEGDGANFGLRDQEVAFEWVKQHIARFGGNPDDITAFGESAGSISIALHMISREGDQKLFKRAIMESGAYTTTADIATPVVQEKQTTTIAQGVGCGDATDVMACIRKADVSKVFAVGGALNWIPTVDKKYMLDMPIRRVLEGKISEVPSIIGTNSDEGWGFTGQVSEASQFDSFIRTRFSLLNEAEFAKVDELYPASAFLTPHHRAAEVFGDVIFVCPSEQFTQAIATRRPTYRYHFNFTSNESGYPLVVHAKDLAYVFNTVATLPKDDDTKAVVQYFQQYWTTFARTGSPNGASDATQSAGTTVWPQFSMETKQQLVIQPTLTTETMGSQRAGHDARCAFWLDVEQRVSNDVAFFA